MFIVIVLFGMSYCEPSIKTLSDNYTYGDSIGLEIINPCDSLVGYYVFLERYDDGLGKWLTIDVDVFTHHLYIGPFRDLMPRSSQVIYNLEKDYGEQFLRDYYKRGGRFRYGIAFDFNDKKELRRRYSNEFIVVPPE